MARSVMVPLPDDVTVADLDRAFTGRTTPSTAGGVTYTSTRSEPGGPYRVTFARTDAAAGELGRLVLSGEVERAVRATTAAFEVAPSATPDVTPRGDVDRPASPR